MNTKAPLTCASIIGVLVIAIGPASAEMHVLESNVPEFRAGTRIADTNEMQLPPGGQVRVLILPANETRVFKGPSATQRSLRDVPLGGTRGPATPLTQQ